MPCVVDSHQGMKSLSLLHNASKVLSRLYGPLAGKGRIRTAIVLCHVICVLEGHQTLGDDGLEAKQGQDQEL
eukprot:1162081-Pelagomonas_calceolata.AAC.2